MLQLRADHATVADAASSQNLLRSLSQIASSKSSDLLPSPQARSISVVRSPKGPQRAALGLVLQECLVPPGCRIIQVDPEGPAGRMGLWEGDVITGVNGFPTPNVETFGLLFIHLIS